MDNYQTKLSRYIYNLETDDNMSNLFREGLPVSVSSGLGVYRKNLIFGFLNILKKVFPFTETLLDPDNFRFFVREYIYQHHSTSSDLSDYGDKFPSFLASRNELSHLPWLEDLASFEWNWSRLGLYDAVQSADSEHLHPSVLLFKCSYDILSFWNLFDKGQVVDEALEPVEEDQYLIMSQSGDQDCINPVDKELYDFMLAVQKAGKVDVSLLPEHLSFKYEAMIYELRQRGWLTARV